MADHHTAPQPPLAPGLLPNVRFDLVAGFLVFLIAMPLCLAVARACKYPPIAGVWTALISDIVFSIISNLELAREGFTYGAVAIG